MKCVVEGVAAVGVKGLLEFVPGGKYLHDVGAHALKRHREKKAHKKIEDEMKEVIAAKADVALAVAKQAVEEAAPHLAKREKELLTQFVAAIPEAARQSMKRKDDPSGHSLPFGYTINDPDDIVKLLPQYPPRFVPGEWVPGREDNWRLEKRLGGGGFGEVWLARHAFSTREKPRAVKFCTDAKARQKLVTHEKAVIERVMRQVGDHPNIVPLLECHLSGPAPWLMYEFVEGGTLAEEITELAKLGAVARRTRAVAVLHSVAGAVARGHALAPAPVVHRDLKPANVLMAGGVPRVTDYGIGGLAAEFHSAEVKAGTYTAAVERLPSLLRGSFSPLYSSPQQRDGDAPDPRDDVHALGVLAYQMLVGRVDAEVKGNWATRLKKDGVPDTLLNLIGSSTSDEAADRPKDAREWQRALEPFLPIAKPPRRISGRTIAAMMALLLLIGACVVIMLRSASERNAEVKPDNDPGKPPAQHNAAFKPGEEREVEIAPGVNMTFCWVPAGECQLGSPRAEREAVSKAAVWAVDSEWLQLEAEGNRGKFKTNGFWMGKYEVTQAQWKAVMGDNPSEFNGIVDNKAKGMDTSRFPVERVSWDMISGTGQHVGKGFLNKVNAHDGVHKAFGKAGTFVLPHEDQWEYACRAGRGNARAFYWGDTLNGTQANIKGNYPYGITDKGTYLERTCAVDVTDDTRGNTYDAHPWGLVHMHGNVCELCENTYTNSAARVVRGGSWVDHAHFSRAAARLTIAPDGLWWFIGFRVCLR